MDELNPELYKKLFEYIENGCKQHDIEKDYVKYLLSMEQAESIEQLIKIYNNIFKLLAFIFYGSKNVPYNWYLYECWGYKPHRVVTELQEFYNDSILKWYKKQNNPTEEQCILCIVNLRECPNTENRQKEILEIAAGNVAESVYSLVSWRGQHYQTRIKIGKVSSFYNKQDLLNDYKRFSQLLAANGRIFDVVEEAFAKQHNIDYNELLVQHKKKLEEEEIARKKEEEQKMEEATNKKVKNFLAVVVIITLGIIFMIIIEKIGFFGIIIIIGLIGLIPKIFLTGKI